MDLKTEYFKFNNINRIVIDAEDGNTQPQQLKNLKLKNVG